MRHIRNILQRYYNYNRDSGLWLYDVVLGIACLCLYNTEGFGIGMAFWVFLNIIRTIVVFQ